MEVSRLFFIHYNPLVYVYCIQVCIYFMTVHQHIVFIYLFVLSSLWYFRSHLDKVVMKWFGKAVCIHPDQLGLERYFLYKLNSCILSLNRQMRLPSNVEVWMWDLHQSYDSTSIKGSKYCTSLPLSLDIDTHLVLKPLLHVTFIANEDFVHISQECCQKLVSAFV